MNSLPRDTALADRWWMIEVPGYNTTEKVEIVRGYLLPKALKNVALKKTDITISEETCKYLINKVCKSDDKGVRTIEKSIADIVNKVCFLATHQDADGKLPFSTTFKMCKKLSYPVALDRTILDNLVANKELNHMLHLMYL